MLDNDHIWGNFYVSVLFSIHSHPISNFVQLSFCRYVNGRIIKEIICTKLEIWTLALESFSRLMPCIQPCYICRKLGNKPISILKSTSCVAIGPKLNVCIMAKPQKVKFWAQKENSETFPFMFESQKVTFC